MALPGIPSFQLPQQSLPPNMLQAIQQLLQRALPGGQTAPMQTPPIIPPVAAAPAAPVPTPPPTAANVPQTNVGGLGAVLNPAIGTPINPFEGPPEPNPAFNQAAQTVPEGSAQPMAATDKPRRLQAWRDFIGRVKTDPDMRMALFQAGISMTQPANSAAESIGRGLGVGQQTLEALRTTRIGEQRQAAEDQRAERGVAVQEGALEQRATEAQNDMQVKKQELEVRLKQLEQDAAYQQEMLRLRRAEVNGAGGQAGQVNQRWQQLTDAMLAQPDSDLLKYTDPEERRNRARLRAFDQINNAGQTRQQFIAKSIESMQLMEDVPSPSDPNFAAKLAEVAQKASAFADAAGMFDERVAPPQQGSAPAGGAPPRISTDEEYNALPSGTEFLDPAGNLRVKP